MNKCEYCNREFKSSSNLGLHQRTAKYCLKLQGVLIVSDYKCPNCDIQFLRKAHLDNHILICKMAILSEQSAKFESMQIQLDKMNDMNNLYKKKIRQLNKEIKILREKASNIAVTTSCEIYEKLATKTQNDIVEIAKQPNTTNTTNTTNNNLIINNAMSFKPEDIKAGIIDKITGNTLIGGPKDLVKLCLPYITDNDGNTMYPCTDTNRGIFWYLNEEGKKTKDAGGIKFINQLHQSGLKSAVYTQAAGLMEQGLALEDVKGYTDQFSEDGNAGKNFTGAFRKHLAAATSVL